MGMGTPFNPKDRFKPGDYRLVQRYAGTYPVKLLEKVWGPYGERPQWRLQNMLSAEEEVLAEGCVSVETLNEMEVLAWAAT